MSTHRNQCLNRLARIFCLGVVLAIPLASAAQPSAPEFSSGEFIIKLMPGIDPGRLQSLLDANRLVIVRRFSAAGSLHIRGAESRHQQILSALRSRPEILYAEPNYIRYLNVIPDDPGFSYLDGLHNVGQTGGTVDADIDAPEAWEITVGSNDIVVGVIDSGIDLGHPDLAPNLWTNPGEIPGNSFDDDGNGFVDDVHGWDFRDGDNDPSETAPVVCASHGVHTAGTVGARGNNGIGVVGVNWNVSIMPLRAFGPALQIFCSARDADIIAAIDYATSFGVRILNNSYGGGPASAAVEDAIRRCNCIFVAASGNDGADNDITPHYPSNYDLPNIIAVAATDANDRLALFSNYGDTTVHIAAPGVNIVSTINNGGYGALSGTSMAAPHVAGVAALLLADDPSLTNQEVIWRILNGGDPKGLPVITGRRLNAAGSLTISPPQVTIELLPLGPTTVSPGERVSYRVNLHNLATTAKSVSARVVALTPFGHEMILEQRALTLPGSFSGGQDLTVIVPNNAPGGTYYLSAVAEVEGESFDEDVEQYAIIR